MKEVYKTSHDGRSAYIINFDSGKYIVYCHSMYEGNPSAHHWNLEEAIIDADCWVRCGRFT